MVVSLDISWMDRGACLTRPDLPWTQDTFTLPPFVADDVVVRMVEVCSSCLVLASCGEMASGMTGGFWAGRDRAVKPKVKRGRWVQPSLGLGDPDGLGALEVVA